MKGPFGRGGCSLLLQEVLRPQKEALDPLIMKPLSPEHANGPLRALCLMLVKSVAHPTFILMMWMLSVVACSSYRMGARLELGDKAV